MNRISYLNKYPCQSHNIQDYINNYLHSATDFNPDNMQYSYQQKHCMSNTMNCMLDVFKFLINTRTNIVALNLKISNGTVTTRSLDCTKLLNIAGHTDGWCVFACLTFAITLWTIGETNIHKSLIAITNTILEKSILWGVTTYAILWINYACLTLWITF